MTKTILLHWQVLTRFSTSY